MSRDFRELGGRDAYALLGLAEDADAREIKRAWRAMSRLHHADVGGSDNIQSLLNVAYDTLSDRALRDEYDRYRRTVLLVGATSPPPARRPPPRPWQQPPPPAPEPAARKPHAREPEPPPSRDPDEGLFREPPADRARASDDRFFQAWRPHRGKPDAGQPSRDEPEGGLFRGRQPHRDELDEGWPAQGEPEGLFRERQSHRDEPDEGWPSRGEPEDELVGERQPYRGEPEDELFRGRQPHRGEPEGGLFREWQPRPEESDLPESGFLSPDEWDRWEDDEPEQRRFESEPEQGRHEAAPPFNSWSAPRQADPRRDFISTARPVGYDNLAIISLVLALVFAPAALVTAPMALYRIRRTGAQGRALAITALILVGVLTIALTSGYVIGTRTPVIAR
ncbi:DnaJ domain-containing protein [Catenuloplanes japonicus]|uniref:DnaJ domain-containing protein n=1 Tax=Catenuloplanes japonicus TaxID=33876 RepID=UPI0012F738BD|nr:DnaJ domain-containing protein [Catenuloplanes japonicus]